MDAFPTAHGLWPSASRPLPDLRRTDQHIVRIEGGQKEPPPAVEEAPPHDVHAEEPPEGAEHEGAHARRPPLRHRLLGGERGVTPGTRQEVADVAIRAVLQVAG